MKRHERIEDWCDRTADIAWAELVEIKDDDELVAALEMLRQAAIKVQQLAYARFHKNQLPNKVVR